MQYILLFKLNLFLMVFRFGSGFGFWFSILKLILLFGKAIFGFFNFDCYNIFKFCQSKLIIKICYFLQYIFFGV